MQYDLRTLDRAQTILNKSGIGDELIRNGAKLRPAGYQRLGRAMGVSPHDAKDIYIQLIGHLRDTGIEEDYSRFMEGDERYGFEKDFLGNVTIRDTVSGEDKFLSGDQSTELLSMLEAGGDEQAILAQFMQGDSLNEDDEELEEDENYDQEIATSFGTYNFPWKIQGDSGFATASYGGSDDPKKMRIMSVSDSRGDQIAQPSPELIAELKKQAIAFIGQA